MNETKKRIREYQNLVQNNYVRKEAEQQTIKACQDIQKTWVLQKRDARASYFEFLYTQSKFIKKRWWIMQGAALFFLWFWMKNYAEDLQSMIRLMGVIATVFVVLIIPEFWKSRRNAAIEIEQASFYTLHQVCSARTLLFAAADLFGMLVFLAVTYHTVPISFYNLIIHFLLPINVAACICFRLLYSKQEDSEYLAIFLCLVWSGIWLIIVANDVIYQKIAGSLLGAFTVLSFVYLIFCIRRSLRFDEKILEGYYDGIRA